MTQQPHFTATATAQDISDGLEAGCYLAQVGTEAAPDSGVHVKYATSRVAPTDLLDYFIARAGEEFTFTAGDNALPTWVMRGNSMLPTVPVAISKL